MLYVISSWADVAGFTSYDFDFILESLCVCCLSVFYLFVRSSLNVYFPYLYTVVQ